MGPLPPLLTTTCTPFDQKLTKKVQIKIHNSFLSVALVISHFHICAKSLCW